MNTNSINLQSGQVKTFRSYGSPTDMASQQGIWAKEYFGAMLENLKSLPQLTSWLPISVIKFYLYVKGKSFLKEHQGSLKADGRVKIYQCLADALGANISLVYGAHCFEILASNLSVHTGCTSIATKLENGDPIIAYNHDFSNVFAAYITVRVREPESGIRSLSVTYPPLLGSIAGINSKGLAITINHAFESHPKRGRAELITLLLQDCLDRFSNIQECIEYLEWQKVPSGSILTMSDESSNQCAVEMTSQKICIRRVSRSALVSFNTFENPEMKSFEVPQDAIGKGFIRGTKIHEHFHARDSKIVQ